MNDEILNTTEEIINIKGEKASNNNTNTSIKKKVLIQVPMLNVLSWIDIFMQLLCILNKIQSVTPLLVLITRFISV